MQGALRINRPEDKGLNNLLAAAGGTVTTVHDWSQQASAVVLFYGVIALLGSAVVWFIVRDRNSIAAQLERLNAKFDELMVNLLANYTTKEEFRGLERDLHRHLEQSTLRAMERRTVVDSENG
jgi:hypothetical protein